MSSSVSSDCITCVIVDIFAQKSGNICIQQIAVKFSVFPVYGDCFIPAEHKLIGIPPGYLIIKIVNKVLSNTEMFLRGIFDAFPELQQEFFGRETVSLDNTLVFITVIPP